MGREIVAWLIMWLGISLYIIGLAYANSCTGDVFAVEQDGFTYDKNHPIIWIGGYPRSGTTLMRVFD